MLDFSCDDDFLKALSPFQEMVSYEVLWDRLSPAATFERLSDSLKKDLGDGPLPTHIFSCMVDNEDRQKKSADQVVMDAVEKHQVGFRTAPEPEYPESVLSAKQPAYGLYFQGFWNLLEPKSVSVVGARKATDDGKKRTAKLVRQLVKDDYAIVSGLAEGIDTAAHQAAIDADGLTIAVLGTPINQQYPASNKKLREEIRNNHLVISQYPLSSRTQPHFFTTRNKLMSALADATVIVEASDTSGTMIQAHAALEQNKKLFILNSCFENPDITWPLKLQEKGAVRVSSYDDIKEHLQRGNDQV